MLKHTTITSMGMVKSPDHVCALIQTTYLTVWIPLSLSLAKDDALVIQSLNKLKSKDEKLDTLIQKYAELVSLSHTHTPAQPCI